MDREIQQIQYINDLKRFNRNNISKTGKESSISIYQSKQKIQSL